MVELLILAVESLEERLDLQTKDNLASCLLLTQIQIFLRMVLLGTIPNLIRNQYHFLPIDLTSKQFPSLSQ